MCDESTAILNAESQNQLKIQHDDLLRQSLKLLLLKKVLLEVKDWPKEDEQLTFALRIFRSKDFLRLDNENLLGLHEHSDNVNLSYMTKKDVQKILWESLQSRFLAIRPLIAKLQMDFPHLLEKNQGLNSSTQLISIDSAELSSLDLQRRECLQKLAEIHNRKLKLLKTAAELKLSPAITEKIEVMHLDLSINQVKANLFRDFMVNEFVNNSEYTAKAVKFVEKHIDEQIKKEDY